MPTVAIVGGSGFIGRSLTASVVAAGARVRIVDVVPPPDLHGTEWARCDVLDADGLRDGLVGVNTVYCLAAARGARGHTWRSYRTVNIDGAYNVCEAAAVCHVSRIVFVSSAVVYGREDAPDEQSECRPRGGYGKSKLAAERVYGEWLRASGNRSLAVVRPSVVFGPGHDGAANRLIGLAAHPAFTLAGGGSARKSLAFVENLAAFLHFVGTRPGRTQLFNYCDEPDMTVREVVSTVREALGLGPAQVSTWMSVYGTAVRASISRRLGAEAGPGIRGVRRASRDRRFDAGLAHASGFVQPIDLRDALARTARSDFEWPLLAPQAGR